MPACRSFYPISGLLLVFLCGGSLRAQTPDFIYDGPGAGSEFGTTLAVIGDLDNDGVPEFVVGSPREDTTIGVDAGVARVISGLTGAILYTFLGDGASDTFGVS